MIRKTHIKITTLSLFYMTSTSCYAAAQLMETYLPQKTTAEQSKNSINGFIGGFSNQANRDVGDVPGNRYRGELEFDFHRKPISDKDTGTTEARFHAAAQHNDEGLTQYSVQEAYLAKNLSTKNHLRVGRQILDWSTVDRTWGFGKLNNRRNFDYFEPGQEGLTGISFVRKSSNGMRYRAFLSGVYIPELNPPADIDKKDKTISSRSPWFETPAQETNAGTEAAPSFVPIRYNVDMPSNEEVIWRYSAGFNLGWENKHWRFDNFFIRKPENQITTLVTAELDSIKNTADAYIDPQVFYHDVYGSSLHYKNYDLEMYVSGIAIRPNTFPDGDREATALTEIPTEKRREDYVGGGISRSNDLYALGLNYVARLSPYDRKKDDLAPEPRWNQAVNIFGMRNFGQYLTLLADLKYDMLTRDRLAMLRAIYNASKYLQLSVGVNMIGTPSDGKSFWSPYTNNDQIYGALRLIF